MDYYTTDPVRDAERYYRHQDKLLYQNCPICEVCKEPIQDEKAFNFSHEWIHKECLEEYFEEDYKEVPYGEF